jgi:hypothetical protein
VNTRTEATLRRIAKAATTPVLSAAMPATLTLGARWSGKARSLGMGGARA